MDMVEERREEETVSVGLDEPKGSSEQAPGDPSGPGAGRRPIGDVVRSVIDGVQSLLRSQIELAKLEVVDAVSSRARGIALFAVAGVLGLFALGFLAAAAVAGLDIVLPAWASRLIVAGVFVLIAAVAAFAGKGTLRAAPLAPERTQETLKEDAEWAKQQIKR